MRILLRGNDKGNAMLFSLVLILILSSLFLSLTPHIAALNRAAKKYKAEVLSQIQESNREAINKYDL